MRNEKRDLREVRDSLLMARAVCDMRANRTGDVLSVGEIARLGIEILYEGEREWLRLQQKDMMHWDIVEVPQKL